MCEAAGYDVVIVETVGVGQSETAVAGMTDMFVLLQLPNAGDDLQAIKKGVMELADLVVDQQGRPRRRRRHARAGADHQRLRLLAARPPGTHHDRWSRRCCSERADGEGVDEFWQNVHALRALRRASGELAARRRSRRWPGCGSASRPA